MKLVFSYVVKGIKIKITAEFRGSRRLRFEDTKRIISPEKVRDFRENGSLGWVLSACGFAKVVSIKRYKTNMKSIKYNLKGHCSLQITGSSSVRGNCENLEYRSDQILIATKIWPDDHKDFDGCATKNQHP